MTFPKVLIFGQPFNYQSGGGITLSNLFKGWPKDKIAVLTSGHEMDTATTDICEIYYQLGKNEYEWIFPFNLVQRNYISGLKIINENTLPVADHNHPSIRSVVMNRFFFPAMRWLGLMHCISKISLSDKLKQWLTEFNPEVLYYQVSSRETINYAYILAKHLNIPSVIHIMDDWPSTISNKGFFKNYWKRKIDKEFNYLLAITTKYLSISEAMSEEYLKRYNKEFIVFHNPIEIDSWLPYCKTDLNVDLNKVSVLYSGRIGFGITDSLYEVAEAIEKLTLDGTNIKFHIQTPSNDNEILNRLKKNKSVKINPFAEYSQLPRIFSQADILIIPIDFDEYGSNYLKFSIPTKLSEYMISGTPILAYSPVESAVYKFLEKNECGYCVSHSESDGIMKALKYLINNKSYRETISHNSIEIAKTKFDAEKVRSQFRELLTDISKS
jgi:glycosyltransferase involved in cell wall biosynthesis